MSGCWPGRSSRCRCGCSAGGPTGTPSAGGLASRPGTPTTWLADAGGTLVGGARLLGLGLDTAALAALSASLGSDVPFCLVGGAAWMRGRGEIIEPLPPLPVLPSPSVSVASPAPPGPSGPAAVSAPRWPAGIPAPPRSPTPPGAARLPSASPPPDPSAGSPWPADPEPGGLALAVAVPPFPPATPA